MQSGYLSKIEKIKFNLQYNYIYKILKYISHFSNIAWSWRWEKQYQLFPTQIRQIFRLYVNIKSTIKHPDISTLKSSSKINHIEKCWPIFLVRVWQLKHIFPMLINYLYNFHKSSILLSSDHTHTNIFSNIPLSIFSNYSGKLWSAVKN